MTDILTISDTAWIALCGMVPATIAAVAGLIVSLQNNRHLNDAKDIQQSKNETPV